MSRRCPKRTILVSSLSSTMWPNFAPSPQEVSPANADPVHYVFHVYWGISCGSSSSPAVFSLSLTSYRALCWLEQTLTYFGDIRVQSTSFRSHGTLLPPCNAQIEEELDSIPAKMKALDHEIAKAEERAAAGLVERLASKIEVKERLYVPGPPLVVTSAFFSP